jgi:chromosome partitioning protein
MMKVICIANNKGGTAKTTTAVNLAVGLQALGHRVMVIDLDPQGNLSYYFGITRYDFDSANVIAGDVPLHEAVQTKELIGILPSGPDLGRVEVSLSGFRSRSLVLRSLLQEVSGYDFVIIDCPPGNFLLVQNALAASDLLLIPLKMEALHLRGLSQILWEIEQVQAGINPDLKVLGALPVMFEQKGRLRRNKFRKSEEEVYSYIRNTLKIPLMNTRIHRDVAAIEAPAHGQSLLSYAPKSRAWKDYQALTLEVKNRIVLGV